MATQILTVPVAQRGGGAPIVVNLNFGVNAWKHVEMRINSTDFLTIDGLWLGYSARVSIDGGNTWTPWGGTGVSSPNFKKDGVTRDTLGGLWEWSPAFAAGGILALVVDCPTAFAWGATITLTDT